jgi:hypothetical protein
MSWLGELGRKHDANTNTDTNTDTNSDGMRQLPYHSAVVRSSFDTPVAFVQHLPRHGLQHDHRERVHSCQRRDKHRKREHTGLEPVYSLLLELVPRHRTLVTKKSDDTKRPVARQGADFIIFKHARGYKRAKEVMLTMERNRDGCFTSVSPPAPAGGLDSRTTRPHKNTITNGSRTLFSVGET